MDQIKKLYKKADQTRTIHGLLRGRLVLLDTLMVGYVTVGSAISAMLIFAPIKSELDIWVGIFLASIFIVSLIPSTFDFKQKILSRSLAVQSWGGWIRDAKFICDQGGTESEITDLISRYKEVMNSTPLIPDKLFNKYKQKHLQKVAISKALDDNPFKKIRDIKKELSK